MFWRLLWKLNMNCTSDTINVNLLRCDNGVVVGSEDVLSWGLLARYFWRVSRCLKLTFNWFRKSFIRGIRRICCPETR